MKIACGLMANALQPVASCDILKQHPKLKFREGTYTSEIVRAGEPQHSNRLGPLTKMNKLSHVSFQPYRLTNSKCYHAPDARIRCTACHDPHRDLSELK